jgi:hypothetical protein
MTPLWTPTGQSIRRFARVTAADDEPYLSRGVGR